jgi:hypothetical protein
VGKISIGGIVSTTGDVLQAYAGDSRAFARLAVSALIFGTTSAVLPSSAKNKIVDIVFPIFAGTALGKASEGVLNDACK